MKPADPRYRLRSRTYVITVLILISGLCLFWSALLNYFNYVKTLRSLTNTRFTVIAQDLINPLEYGVNIGLKLREIKTAQDRLAEAAKFHPDITEMFVTDDSGTLLFHSAPGTRELSPGLRNRLRETNLDKISSSGLEDSHLLLYPITNQYNVRVGTLGLRYPSALIRDGLLVAARQFVAHFVGVFLVSAIVIFVVIHMLFAGFTRGLDAVSAEVRGLGDGRAAGTAESPFGSAFTDFRTASANLVSDLDAAEAEIARLEGPHAK